MHSKRYYFIKQKDSKDCGIACLVMVFRFLVGYISYDTVLKKCDFSLEGVSLKGIIYAAKQLNLDIQAFYAKSTFLSPSIEFPLIALVNQNHYVVIYSIYTRKKTTYIKVADPAFGIKDYRLADFINIWINNGKGVLAYISKTEKSFLCIEKEISKLKKISELKCYITENWKPLIYLSWAFFIILCIQLILPFLAQDIVDKGIAKKNISFIWLFLIAQMTLVISKCLIDISRAQITIYLSSKISTQLLSKYLSKLLKIRISFFTKRTIGDLIQRMEDHSRIVTFLSTDTVTISVSIIGLIVSGFVLIHYNYNIFLIYIICILGYAAWTSLFLDKRKSMDYDFFKQQSIQTSSMYQLFDSIEEIKIQGCSNKRTHDFETIYSEGLKLGIKRLTLFQMNKIGATFINQGRDIIITVLTSLLVIKGELSLGTLLAIQYVMGQMESPIDQIINFIYKWQDLRIGLKRISAIYSEEDEVNKTSKNMQPSDSSQDIKIKELSYKYNIFDKKYALQDISFTIPKDKITAIVGLSGSGKTTLLKLLLGYDKPSKGNITIGNVDLGDLNIEEWRKKCGVVMQDGYIFSDTIENNIAIADNIPIEAIKMQDVAQKTCIDDFIYNTPSLFNTQIGKNGRGLSKGQKQRILISRIMYKDPQYIFLDEATNSLDSYTEKKITTNLQYFFQNKTVLVIAHRLSTIKNADNIIVLDKGHIVEEGCHKELMKKRGKYFELVNNQLECD